MVLLRCLILPIVLIGLFGTQEVLSRRGKGRHSYKPSAHYGFSLPVSHPPAPTRYAGRQVGYSLSSLHPPPPPQQPGRQVVQKPPPVVFGVAPQQLGGVAHFAPNPAIPPRAPGYQSGPKTRPVQKAQTKKPTQPVRSKPAKQTQKAPKAQQVQQVQQAQQAQKPQKAQQVQQVQQAQKPQKAQQVQQVQQVQQAPKPQKSQKGQKAQKAQKAQKPQKAHKARLPVNPANVRPVQPNSSRPVASGPIPSLPAPPVSLPKNVNQKAVAGQNSLEAAKIPENVPEVVVVHSTIYGAAYSPGSSPSSPSSHSSAGEQTWQSSPISQEIPTVTPALPVLEGKIPVDITTTESSIAWSVVPSIGHSTETNYVNQPAVPSIGYSTETNYVNQPVVPSIGYSTETNYINQPAGTTEPSSMTTESGKQSYSTTPAPIRPLYAPEAGPVKQLNSIKSSDPVKPTSSPTLKPYTKPITTTTTRTVTSQKSDYDRFPITTYRPYSTIYPESSSTYAPVTEPIISTTKKSSYQMAPTSYEKYPTKQVSSPGESVQLPVNNPNMEVVKFVGTPDYITSSASPDISTSYSRTSITESTTYSGPAYNKETFTPASPTKVISGQNNKPSYQSSFYNPVQDSSPVKPVPNKLPVYAERLVSNSKPNYQSETRPSEDPVSQKPGSNKPVGNFIDPVESTLAAAAVGFQVFNDLAEKEGDYSAISGQPGTDYPIFSEVPDSKFNCSEQSLPGYYADESARCQVFHICLDDRQWSFLCPNGTIFSQEHFVCVWWYEFDCSRATSLYNRNERLYQVITSNQEAPALKENREYGDVVNQAAEIIGKRIGTFEDYAAA